MHKGVLSFSIQRDCPKYVQGNMTGFYVQINMSKEVVQEGMTKRVCSGECLGAYIQGIFPIGSGYVKALIPEVYSGVCTREYVQVVCQRDCPKYVPGNMTKFYV